MPQDRDPPPEPRAELALSTLVGAVSLVLGLVIAALLIAGGYQIARHVIAAELDRSRDGTRQIARLMVAARLQDIERILDPAAGNRALRVAMAEADRDRVASELALMRSAAGGQSVDALFARMADGGVVGASGGDRSAPETLAKLVAPVQAGSVSPLVVETADGPWLLAGRAMRGTAGEPSAGGVLAALDLRADGTLLTAIGGATGAVAVLRTGDPATEPPADGIDSVRTVLPLTGPAGAPVAIVSRHASEAMGDLADRYWMLIAAVVFLVILTALACAWAMRLMIRRASAGIAASIAGVNRRQSRAAFRRTPIREFNEVGATLARYVSALRESEARAQLILNNAPVPISIKSVDGVYNFANRAFEQSTGIAAQDVVGRHASDIFPPEVAEAVDRTDKAVVDRRESLQFETEIQVAGTFRAMLVTKFPLLDRQGDVSGVCSIASDITPMKLSERAMTDALAAAESASQAKSRFLATMSHEFRTPLNAILGFSDLIRQQFMGPAGNETYVSYADDIHRSGQQMRELVDEILDNAAIEAGQRIFECQPVDLSAVTREVVRLFEPAVDAKGLTLDCEVADDLPEVLSDQRAVLQVLQNLLSNAVKFTPTGGRVSVRAAMSQDDGVEVGTVALQVADDGVGMPPDVVANVTEPFYQNRSDPHLADGGTGLGLSIVKSIVDALGGTLEIDSVDGRGTTVTVRLPANGGPGGTRTLTP
ncbi:MAG: PAS domain-containing sensor histidine kinase [Thalassobaculaceae bacterium]